MFMVITNSASPVGELFIGEHFTSLCSSDGKVVVLGQSSAVIDIQSKYVPDKRRFEY